MNTLSEEQYYWWQQKPVWVMLFLGFSAGVPYLLIFSSLSLWLREAGVSRSAVTFFSWAALGYSFKFVWAPLVDKLPLPILSRLLGRRRSWLLLSQVAVISAICFMAMTDPQEGLVMMAVAAVLLGFSSATQDIVIDAFRIESADQRLQAMLSATYMTGYRIGMMAAGGAGALYLAEWLGSTAEQYSYLAWRNTYFCMAALMGVGVLTTLLIKEPEQNSKSPYLYPAQDYFRFVLAFAIAIASFICVFVISPKTPDLFVGYAQKLFTFAYLTFLLIFAMFVSYWVARVMVGVGVVNRELVKESYITPVVDFIHRYHKLALWVLLLVGFYRVSDIVMGVITSVFYHDMGYSKQQIATVTKVFGIFMTIAGSFAGGFLTLRYGVLRVLMLGAVLVSFTNLLFMWLANIEADINALVIVIAADNLSAGIATVAFIAWLSSLTNISFTATQYAIFSSLMTLFPKLIGGYSGTMVEQVGYANFFLFASCLGIPVIVLIWYVQRRLQTTTND